MADKVTFGHYRVLQRDDGSLWELGSSAVGVTYKALDTDLQRPVALKVINSDLLADEVNRDRFLREARAAAGLRHSNIASIYHLGKEPVPVKGRQLVTFKPSVVRHLWRNDEEQFFYAMEFIEGQTTESYVARFGPMPLRSALRIAWQVSRALVAAARQQFVHRDIKPANIMIVADSEEGDWPFVKLTDFGLARSVLLADDSDGTTRPEFLGTAQSGSPEQSEEGNMDARSDIYSLGCTLWYLLTGEAIFIGSPTSDFAQHLGDKPPWACRVWSLLTDQEPVTDWPTTASTQQLRGEPPWEKLKPFPRQIRRLLRRMLRKESSQRPASAIEVATRNRAVPRRHRTAGSSRCQDRAASKHRSPMVDGSTVDSSHCDLWRLRDGPGARPWLLEQCPSPTVRTCDANERCRASRGFRQFEPIACQRELVLSRWVG